jgi:23S rRNA (guanosine2251-2'-O)-methyltransferase
MPKQMKPPENYATIQHMPKYNAKELRKIDKDPKDLVHIKHNPLYLILDEVLDTYNIGSLFRLADAVGVTKMYLCGKMEYPPSSRIHKSAVGTENWVPWEKHESALEVVKELKAHGVQTIAVEQDPTSISYKELEKHLQFPCAIIVGHESDGVKKEVLDEVDLIIELPMFGINKSFNVWGTAAVVAYKVLESLED